MFWLILQVFVEFENASQRCSWVQVYDEGVKAVLVEDAIVWARRGDSTETSGAPAPAWPALVSAELEISESIKTVWAASVNGEQSERFSFNFWVTEIHFENKTCT